MPKRQDTQRRHGRPRARLAGTRVPLSGPLVPPRPSDMQASCVKSNMDRVCPDCVTVLISAESRSFPKDVRGLWWTEQENTWRRPAFSPPPLLLTACQLRDTHTLYCACAWTARGPDGGGDTRHASGAVSRAWAGSCGPVHSAGSRWNGSDLSTGAEGRGPSFSE